MGTAGNGRASHVWKGELDDAVRRCIGVGFFLRGKELFFVASGGKENALSGKLKIDSLFFSEPFHLKGYETPG